MKNLCLSWDLNLRFPVLRTGDKRFKSQLKHKFFSLFHMSIQDSQNIILQVVYHNSYLRATHKWAFCLDLLLCIDFPLSLPPRWCPWDLFRSFKVCSDAKESVVRKATGSYHTYSSLVKLQPRFLSLQWKTCLCAELQPWCPSLQ